MEADVRAHVNPTPAQVGSPAGLLALAAGLLGMALHIRDGLYTPYGVAILALSLAVTIVAVLPIATRLGSLSPRRFELFLTLLLLGQLIALPMKVAGSDSATVATVSQWPFHIGFAIAVIATLIILLGTQRLALAGFILLLITHGGIGIWKIRTAPHPRMDVYMFHEDSAAALARGENPYELTFPNIHGRTDIYAPGVVVNDRLQFGFPYPPLVLLWTAAAQLGLGDFRYAQLIAMLATGILLAVIGRGRPGMLIAGLLLFTPRAFYILEIGWTEPLSAMLIAGTIVCAIRLREAMPIVLGLFLASKQYIPVAIALTPLLLEDGFDAKKLIRMCAIAILTAAVVSLPLALWDWNAFWSSAVMLQLHQPYRGDSLSFLAWWGYGTSGWVGPFWTAFATLAMGIALSLRKIRPGPAGFASAVALCFLLFFAFNKQAFANYYYLVVASLCCAAAAGIHTTRSHEVNEGTRRNTEEVTS